VNKPLRELALNVTAPLLGYRLGPHTRGSKRAVTCPDGQVLELSLHELWDYLREHHGAELDAPPRCCAAGCTTLAEMLERHGTAAEFDAALARARGMITAGEEARASARYRLLLCLAT
jgi:hypothetical protein